MHHTDFKVGEQVYTDGNRDVSKGYYTVAEVETPEYEWELSIMVKDAQGYGVWTNHRDFRKVTDESVPATQSDLDRAIEYYTNILSSLHAAKEAINND